MYSIKPPKLNLKQKKNDLNLSIDDYKGGLSTLCGGCGHDSITAAIIQACFELSIPPHKVAKMSGIGCSSKTPGYFIKSAHGFNAVHGRMPAVTSGAFAAQGDLFYLAVSGDGDTGSIGLGHFVHSIRRKLRMTYIIENNGIYGLTKGQFSAMADKDAYNKKGELNEAEAIDPVLLAVQMGATYVARGFSGDKKQLVPLIKGALSHRGFALLDVLSPCVSFNNHAASTRSYKHIRENSENYLGVDDFVPMRDEIKVDFEPGTSVEIPMHDGSQLRLRKIDASYDPHDQGKVLERLLKSRQSGEIATGLLYYDKEASNYHDVNLSSNQPLRDIPLTQLSLSSEQLRDINRKLK